VQRHVEPEDESQDIETQEAVERGNPDAGATISKSEAVRRALAAGKELPDEGVAYIRQQFGIEIAKPHFSATKSQIKKREGGPAKGNPGRKPTTAAEGYLAPPPKQRPSDDAPDLIESLEALKPLVAEYGAEKVKRLVDLLG